MSEIYYCKRIWKERDTDIQKGDVGWLEDIELPEIEGRVRFLLSDIIQWKEWKSEEDFWKNKEEKIIVYFREGPTQIILVKLEEFDKIMDKYYNSIVQYKQN